MLHQLAKSVHPEAHLHQQLLTDEVLSNLRRVSAILGGAAALLANPATLATARGAVAEAAAVVSLMSQQLEGELARAHEAAAAAPAGGGL